MKILGWLSLFFLASNAVAQQAPWQRADVPVSSRDRVYTADQTSNTVSVIDPSGDSLLGVIKLGDAVPGALSPLYTGELLVHGLGYSPDSKTLSVVSVGSNSVTLIETATNRIKGKIYVGRSPHEAFFTPNGRELWVTVRGEDYVSVIDPVQMKEVGKVQVFNAQPPFQQRALFDTGPITNHVNFANNRNGKFAYVTIGGMNEVKVFLRGVKPELAASIPVGNLPHGIWPSGDGTKIYVALENGERAVAIDTLSNKVTAEIPIGQTTQALVYVPNAVPNGSGTDNLTPLGDSGNTARLHLQAGEAASPDAQASVAVNSLGLLD